MFTFHAAVPSAPLTFSRHAHAIRNDPTCTSLSYSTSLNDENDGAGIRLKKKRKRTNNDAASAGPIRKKRRLRLTLITSRLSQPFAVPTTHIADRGRSRIAAWAKQQKKALWGRALLRKAAVLNRATLRSIELRAGQSPNIVPAELEMLLRRKGIEMARYNCYAPSPPSPLRQSNSESMGNEEEDKRHQAHENQEETEVSKREEEKEEGKEEENDSAYFDSLIFGLATTAVAAADSPALSNNSVFVSDYDRLDDLNGGSNDDGFASSVLSSPGRASSPSTATVATALTTLTDEDEAAASLDAGRCLSNSPASMLFFDQLAEIMPDGNDVAAPAAILHPPLLPLEQPEPKNVSKRPPRPKGWNPNFASAPPLAAAVSELSEKSEKV
ncbi:uncharacterized protein LTHEOB_9722 [Lasiodiplodia theobromae]|uniref:uncharacterized protein n=1 Tax=Lasiodiplodia theobromae TaxID=45133 RepID=UPI0015C2F77F|nr:uncharacterized protein LTHEOB_9722 [Lasiodiplodia theobromae]KAF4539910.1 hypothetical protein LTHEOB_9722 [Lasiodiplodia theobromae]